MLKKKLQGGGAQGILGLGHIFRAMDLNGDGTLDAFEFEKAMGEFGVRFSKEEAKMLFTYFDSNRD